MLVFLLTGLAATAALAAFAVRTARVRASYRPERHYMRGPGPKWREKHRGQ